MSQHAEQRNSRSLSTAAFARKDAGCSQSRPVGAVKIQDASVSPEPAHGRASSPGPIECSLNRSVLVASSASVSAVQTHSDSSAIPDSDHRCIQSWMGCDLQWSDKGRPLDSPGQFSHRRELKAVFLGLKTFCSEVVDPTIRLEIDNITAVAYVNWQGRTHSFQVCTLARDIWDGAHALRLFLMAVHVPGVSNVNADYLSRHLIVDGSDWKLDTTLFSQIVTQEGPLLCNLFAARHNRQLPRYVSWWPDPDAVAADALSPVTYGWMLTSFLLSH